MEKNEYSTYIGDGVYMEFSGYDFQLYTMRMGGKHYIHLEMRDIENIYNKAKAMVARARVEAVKAGQEAVDDKEA